MCHNVFVQQLVLIVTGFSAGIVVAGGVFTVFTAVGLVPRFADRINAGAHILLFENMIICGVLLGLLLSVYAGDVGNALGLLRSMAADMGCAAYRIVSALGKLVLSGYGLFTGCYVGCLALSIAEILDAIPIMAQRAKLKRGIGIVILCFAIGKLAGALFYHGFGFAG